MGMPINPKKYRGRDTRGKTRNPVRNPPPSGPPYGDGKTKSCPLFLLVIFGATVGGVLSFAMIVDALYRL
jgi:hypothetical protein